MSGERRPGDHVLSTPAGRGLAALAVRQHGVVATGQLVDLGLSPTAIRGRVRKGWLHRVHRGVYAVGHPRVSSRGRLWAAVLASGGALSHRSAAAAWDLMPAPTRVEVTTPRASAPPPRSASTAAAR